MPPLNNISPLFLMLRFDKGQASSTSDRIQQPPLPPESCSPCLTVISILSAFPVVVGNRKQRHQLLSGRKSTSATDLIIDPLILTFQKRYPLKRGQVRSHFINLMRSDNWLLGNSLVSDLSLSLFVPLAHCYFLIITFLKKTAVWRIQNRQWWFTWFPYASDSYFCGIMQYLFNRH